MRFPFRELHGLEDVQNNFEALEAKAILDRTPAFGTGTLVWPGGAPGSNAFVINHGLGRTPVWCNVFVTGLAPGPSAFYIRSQDQPTSVSFTVYGQAVAGNNIAAGTAGTFLWFALA